MGLDSAFTYGDYTLSLTDANDCDPVTTTFKLTNPDTLKIDTVHHVVTYGHGASVKCSGDSLGQIKIEPSGGVGLYDFFLIEGVDDTIALQYGATEKLFDNIPVAAASSTYTVWVVDELGCSFDTTLTLTRPTQVEVSDTAPIVATGYNIGCKNDNAEVTFYAERRGFCWIYFILWTYGQF